MSMNTQQLIQKFRGETNPAHLLALAQAIGPGPLISYIEGLYGAEQAAVVTKLQKASDHALFMQTVDPGPPTVH